jgi:uncharacterized membrane protein
MADEAVGLTGVVDAPVDKIIDALTDFETFPEWQAIVIESEVLERDDEGRGSLVRMKIDAKIRKIEYIVRYHYDLPTSLGWRQTTGDLKENIGNYRFAPREDGSTDVTLDIVAEPGFFVPGPMKNLLRDHAIKNSIRELKKRVEG